MLMAHLMVQRILLDTDTFMLNDLNEHSLVPAVGLTLSQLIY